MTARTEPDVTLEEAEKAVRLAEKTFGEADLEGMLSCFTEDCVVRFAEQPEINGKAELEQFLRARMARQQGYRLQKTLRAFRDNIIGVEWHGTWTDARTGKEMAGKGLEFWTMRGGRIAIWDAAFNVWEKDGPRQSPVV